MMEQSSKNKIKAEIIRVLQYLIVAGLVIGIKYDLISGWILFVAVAILAGLQSYRADVENYYLRGEYAVDAAVSCIPLFFFPTIKARILIAIISCLVIAIKARPLENGDSYNNKASASSVCNIVLTLQSVCNIYYCFKPGESSRFWNIVFTIALIYIAYTFQTNVEGVQQYDKNKGELEEKERKEREKYEKSDFFQATKIPYYRMMNDSGIKAEYYTSTWLSDISYDYKALYSVCVPVKDELGSTEIDTIVITPAGLYVIEIKNRSLKWLIDGNDKDAYCYDKYGKPQKEYNPVKQNENHMKALRNFIEANGTESVKRAFRTLDSRIVGYIVFAWNTIGWEITNCTQGYCRYKSIGKMIQNDCQKHIDDCHRDYSREIYEIYNFLKQYENNEELRSKHDVLLKIRDWKKNV